MKKLILILAALFAVTVRAADNPIPQSPYQAGDKVVYMRQTADGNWRYFVDVPAPNTNALTASQLDRLNAAVINNATNVTLNAVQVHTPGGGTFGLGVSIDGSPGPKIDNAGNTFRVQSDFNGFFFLTYGALYGVIPYLQKASDLEPVRVMPQTSSFIVGPNSTTDYGGGAGGDMYVPFLTGSTAGTTGLPESPEVNRARALIPTICFTTGTVDFTNSTEALATNRIGQLATNAFFAAMTNLNIPVVIHLDSVWLAPTRDANKYLRANSGYPNGIKPVINFAHSKGIGIRLTHYITAKLPYYGQQVVGSFDGSPAVLFPSSSATNFSGPLVAYTSMADIQRDVYWDYTNGVDQVRFSDTSGYETFSGYQLQQRGEINYAINHPNSYTPKSLPGINTLNSNSIVSEFLSGGHIEDLSLQAALGANIIGLDAVNAGTNGVTFALNGVGLYNLSDFSSVYRDGNMPELGIDDAQIPAGDTNGYRCTLSMAAVVHAPLILSTRVFTNAALAANFTNTQFLTAIAEPRTTLGRPVATNGNCVIFASLGASGDTFVSVFNKGGAFSNQVVTFAQVGVNTNLSGYKVYDLWNQTNSPADSVNKSFTAVVPNYGSALYRIRYSPVTSMPLVENYQNAPYYTSIFGVQDAGLQMVPDRQSFYKLFNTADLASAAVNGRTNLIVKWTGFAFTNAGTLNISSSVYVWTNGGTIFGAYNVNSNSVNFPVPATNYFTMSVPYSIPLTHLTNANELSFVLISNSANTNWVLTGATLTY